MPANEKQAHRSPLTKPEVALYVGTTVRHITRLVQERRIPYFLLAGSSIRFDPETIDKWLEAQPKRDATQPAVAPTRTTRPLKVRTPTNGAKAKSDASNLGAE